MRAAEQKAAAKRFAEFWRGKGYERGQSQMFWTSLLRDVYGVEHPEEVIRYEDKVKMTHDSYIDGHIPSTHVLIEQKSLGKDLNTPIVQSDGSKLTPFQQAQRYSASLPYSQRPRWVVTSNFQSFQIYDMENPNAQPQVVLLKDLPEEYYRLQFLVDVESITIARETKVSMQAGELVGVIYDALKKGYKDPESTETMKHLNVLCVRLVFCLYAEDAGLFDKKSAFHDYLKKHENGARTALIQLFKVLDTKQEDRDPYMDEDLLAFPYVNGGLFADESVIIPRIDKDVVNTILQKASADFDWSQISPTIFGAVFESTLNPETRRSGGMHYTSIVNIHKVIDPLFLEDLRTEYEEIIDIISLKQRTQRLEAFQDKLASLKFLDPACGSGNFLTETYISLRRLENDVIASLIECRKGVAAGQITIGDGEAINPIKVSIGQFYGIEINDFAVTVARTALWIAESQMMQETEEIVHMQLDFLPLKTNATIIEGNALRIKWEDVVAPEELNYIMGNPPFVGASMMTGTQKSEAVAIFGNIHLSNSIDYVGAWYFKTAEMMADNTLICAALVSTNSITQGEQVYPLWHRMIYEGNIHIDFAYRTFRWDSEASSKAHVHCVIIGFSKDRKGKKVLYDESGQPRIVKNINPYLVEGPNVIVSSASKPIFDVPKMTMGNKPTDDGNFILSEEQRQQLIQEDPSVAHLVHRYVGARDFLNNDEIRYCLWLKDVNPEEYIHNKEIVRRLNAIRDFRLKSTAEPTRKSAATPYKFFSTPQRNTDYLIIPRVSSERRRYIPIGFMPPEVIAADSCSIVLDASLYLFGVLTSNVHMSWMRTVAGRLKSDYRYSGAMVYNTFPWPNPTLEQKSTIEQSAQAILDARANHPDVTLAELYGAEKMMLFSDLLKAHQDNDRAVMRAYGFPIKDFTESDCVGALLKMYQDLTNQ